MSVFRKSRMAVMSLLLVCDFIDVLVLKVIPVPCHSLGPFSCGRACGRILTCGNHSCSLECHRVTAALHSDQMKVTRLSMTFCGIRIVLCVSSVCTYRLVRSVENVRRVVPSLVLQAVLTFVPCPVTVATAPPAHR